MSNPDYDKKKFWMDAYGNLILKKKIKGITDVSADERYGKDIKKKKDA